MSDDNTTIGFLDIPYSEMVWSTYSVRITPALLKDFGFESPEELLANVRAGEIDPFCDARFDHGQWGDVEDAEMVESEVDSAVITTGGTITIDDDKVAEYVTKIDESYRKQIDAYYKEKDND